MYKFDVIVEPLLVFIIARGDETTILAGCMSNVEI